MGYGEEHEIHGIVFSDLGSGGGRHWPTLIIGDAVAALQRAAAEISAAEAADQEWEWNPRFLEVLSALPQKLGDRSSSTCGMSFPWKAIRIR